MKARRYTSKYRNIPVTVDGIRFASKREAKRYAELRLLEKAGKIFNLVCQRRFAINVGGHDICAYVADFTYSVLPVPATYTRPAKEGRYVVEDVKSPASRTPVYKLKKKLMEAVHGIRISEV